MARFTVIIHEGEGDGDREPKQDQTDGFMLLYTDLQGKPQYIGQGQVPTPDTSMLQLGIMQLLSKIGNR